MTLAEKNKNADINCKLNINLLEIPIGWRLTGRASWLFTKHGWVESGTAKHKSIQGRCEPGTSGLQIYSLGHAIYSDKFMYSILLYSIVLRSSQLYCIATIAMWI